MATKELKLPELEAGEHAGCYLFPFMNSVMERLKVMGRQRTFETYAAALKSFTAFRHNHDLSISEIDSELMLLYEAYLQKRGLTKNSTSFYMRILRAVYNRAVEKELTVQRYPFRHVYTGVAKSVKRAISLEDIRRIKELDLSEHPSIEFSRDMFIFSFCTRGMSFIDMAFLQKRNLQNGVLSYCRRKTGQRLSIRWERCMEEIVGRYNMQRSNFLLPIIRHADSDLRGQYLNAMCLVNRHLKHIGVMAGLHLPLTMYVARHSWATAARSKNIPISVISEGMGHDSEKTTSIYLASLENSVIDEANNVILREL